MTVLAISHRDLRSKHQRFQRAEGTFGRAADPNEETHLPEVTMASDESEDHASPGPEPPGQSGEASVSDSLELSDEDAAMIASMVKQVTKDVENTPTPRAGNEAIGQGYVQVGGSNFQTNVFIRDSAGGIDARQMSLDSIRHREAFMADFLKQALSQANTTFILSVCFLVLGGLVVLAAAAVAVGGFAGSPSHSIAIASGAGGVLIGASGAAFSRRADRARKHLAQQATMMQSQLRDEQKYAQVIDLLSGINNSKLNDQARISLAMRLLYEVDDNKYDATRPTELPKRRGLRSEDKE